MELKLTQEERELLRELLSFTLSELRMEIADTDSSTYREKLKERKDILKGLMEKLDKEE
ncbi:hypothetical protein Tlie_1768 [Thermovirga lienii DSM 17291]|jgi:hypothetical protein|uniref:Uncharacterized protein n=1 Tax=Thermovirga lienii (strain ATCC BAA-1197 / DSM 17291 / Cas60314) TaxID=580340 RepID=G7V8M9_THELD|nr:hypothetical protein [Thermovirga lienii]AER67490.1 hypothetical protein Tlie_1768 [Thermovirga lienii DSM 17291]